MLGLRSGHPGPLDRSSHRVLAALSLSLAADGTVWAWGDDTYGQLGDGTRADRALPVRVGGVRGVSTVAAGSRHSLAVTGDGSVWAWGDNAAGQLGVPSPGGSSVPV